MGVVNDAVFRGGWMYVSLSYSIVLQLWCQQKKRRCDKKPHCSALHGEAILKGEHIPVATVRRAVFVQK